MIDPDEREQQVTELLAKWPTELEGVLIGGYAVAAYGRPRYSEDIDVLASRESRSGWVRWLEKRQLRRERTYVGPQEHGHPVDLQLWHRGPVSLDLMTGGFRDRDSHSVIPESWILRDPQTVRLELLSGRVDSPVKVVRLEGLWAMKILAGRPQDLTDLFGIMTQSVNLAEVRGLFVSLEQEALRRKLDSALKWVHEPKSYADSLSRLRLGSPLLSENRSAWERFGGMVESAIRSG
ncbi:MAG: nucleotidyl transferase AbiEii/AbiGii toxin family protein [Thermoplasmata archaeon]|nr:nucleotidyl transferase AbiEii/AbiGii toxin family protein [Thermoplasmata archaeon]